MIMRSLGSRPQLYIAPLRGFSISFKFKLRRSIRLHQRAVEALAHKTSTKFDEGLDLARRAKVFATKPLSAVFAQTEGIKADPPQRF